MSTGSALLVALVLLILNAFFVGAEFALISARRSQIEPRADAGSRPARITLRAMERVVLMMTCAQLGITACSLGLGAVGEPAVAALIEGPLDWVGLPSDITHPVALVVALAIVVGLHMVLGEMVPKNLAIADPERAALWLGPPLAGISTLLTPVIVTMNAAANGVVRLCGVRPQPEVASAYDADQVSRMIAESRREGVLGPEEHHLLAGALNFEQRTVDRVVLPTDELVTVPLTADTDTVQQLCVRTGFSRFPVRAATGDELVGYVHVKDFLDPPNGGPTVVSDHLRPLTTVQADAPLRWALATMQSRGLHLARVVDNRGQLLGVATLEDVLEELVGEIRDATRRA
ncbi:MAG TPA: hemolysin family protein [Natronosporangium sp.]|nr:hemolysin family protein [Natronosporangium sp.]